MTLEQALEASLEQLAQKKREAEEQKRHAIHAQLDRGVRNRIFRKVEVFTIGVRDERDE